MLYSRRFVGQLILHRDFFAMIKLFGGWDRSRKFFEAFTQYKRNKDEQWARMYIELKY